MSSFVMLKLKQAKHVQQGTNSIMVASVKEPRKKLKSKTNKNRNKEKFMYTKTIQFTAGILNELMVEYDTIFWGKLFYSFTELLK